jgi:hypothetical protein
MIGLAQRGGRGRDAGAGFSYHKVDALPRG